jgi:hypothetical protein
MNVFFPLLGIVGASTLLHRRASGRGGGLLPQRTGPLRVVHCLPGRVRFRVTSRSVGPERLRRAAEQLQMIEGVESVRVEGLTGSVLIGYQPGRLEPGLFFAALVRLLGVEEELLCIPEPVLTRELREAVASLNQGLYETTGGLADLSSLLLLGALGLGLHGIWRDGPRALPPGFTMLWGSWLLLRSR